MKREVIALAILILLSGCGTTQNEDGSTISNENSDAISNEVGNDIVNETSNALEDKQEGSESEKNADIDESGNDNTETVDTEEFSTSDTATEANLGETNSEIADSNDNTEELQSEVENDELLPLDQKSIEATDLDEGAALDENAKLQEDNVQKEDGAKETAKTLTISMVGDILLHTPVEEAARDGNGSYDFDFIFREMSDEISAADLAVVNQEVIIGGEELGVSGYPAFNAPYEIGDALVNAGFDVVCHATNHALDKGKRGVINAHAFWDSSYPDITVLGINESEDEKQEVTIIERKGIKLALLNYTYGTNGIPMPSDMPYAVDILDEDKVVKDLDYAEENADFTVVFPHWGTEYRLEPDTMQEKWCRIFSDHGADLVIGTHPHVIEPVEFVDNMLVFYSLGNFVNWTSGTGDGVTNRMVGGMAEVTLRKEDDGDVAIDDYGVRAVVCHLSEGHEGVTVYPLKDYTDEMAGQNAILAQDGSFSRVRCEELCNSVWGNLWE